MWLHFHTSHHHTTVALISRSGFSSSPGVLESPVCPTISALHHTDSTFELQRAGMSTGWMGGGSHTAEYVKQTYFSVMPFYNS